MKITLNSARRIFLTLLILIGSYFITVPGRAWGQPQVQVKTSAINEGLTAEFWMRGRLLGRYAGTASLEEFQQIIDNWTSRLDGLFRENTNPSSVKATIAGKTAVVWAGGRQILFFDPTTAKLLKTTPIALAKSWAANIRYQLINAPFLKFDRNQAIVPLGESVQIPFRGRFQGNLEFSGFDSELADVSVDGGGKNVIITGKALGRGSITATAPEVQGTLFFRIQERAAHIPDRLTIALSGNPARASVVRQAFESTVIHRSGPKDGTYAIIGQPLGRGAFKDLSPGQSQTLTIPVKIDGENYIPAIKKVTVTLENTGYRRPESTLLFVSNKPEVVRNDGDLLRRNIPIKTPARYFYHHKNSHSSPWRDFSVALFNKNSYPATVFISPVGAGPTGDEIFAGHQAASAYIDSKTSGWGWFAVIKPNSSLLVEKRLMKADQTISGLGYVNVIEGGPLELACSAASKGEAVSSARQDSDDSEIKDEPRTSRGVFPAFIEMNSSHEIGGKYTHIYLGGEPYQSDMEDGSPNYGNYGAFYRIEVEVSNNQPDEKEARIYMVPGGGVARAIIRVDGQYIETPLVWPAQKVLLKKISVPTGRSVKVQLITMPQGGSFYPVRIVVESDYVKKEMP